MEKSVHALTRRQAALIIRLGKMEEDEDDNEMKKE